MTDEFTDEQAKAAAAPHLEQGTFNFLDHLANREMPTDVVTIFLDEVAGHRIAKLEQDLLSAIDKDQIAVINEQIEHWSEKAKQSAYKVYLRGITNDAYDAIIDEAAEHYPYTYEEQVNPLTMRKERYVVPDEDRNTFFRVHYWAASIDKVEGPDGRVDENITPEFTAILNHKAPVVALARIAMAVDRLRMTGDWMDRLVTDDFLAKS